MTYEKDQRPIIGRQYRRPRFEDRRSDGAYAAYMLRPSHHEALLQNALLAQQPTRNYGRVAYGAALITAVAAYALAWGLA